MKNLRLSIRLLVTFQLLALVFTVVSLIDLWEIYRVKEVNAKRMAADGVAREVLNRINDQLQWTQRFNQIAMDGEIPSGTALETDWRVSPFGKWYYSENRRIAESFFPAIVDPLSQVEEPSRRLSGTTREFSELARRSKDARKDLAAYFKERIAPETEALHAALSEVRLKADLGMARWSADVQIAERRATAYCILGMLVGPCVAFILNILITRSVATPIKSVVEGVSSSSEATAGTAENLFHAADQVSSAAGQFSSTSHSVAEGAGEQAASLQEISAVLEEMAGMTKNNSENAQSAKDFANQARHAADTGATDMKEMIQAMDAIKASADGISKIIKTIDEIAFQTNILALNAAVEAARAGEAGMGFSVVADEVRNLAQRSAVAAKETASLIEDSIRKSESGVRISTKVAQNFQEIVTKARQVDELVAEIASASKEQSQGIDQVNVAINQMDKITQSNAASAEESASASEELSNHAAELKKMVTEELHLQIENLGKNMTDLVQLVGGKAGLVKSGKASRIGMESAKSLSRGASVDVTIHAPEKAPSNSKKASAVRLSRSAVFLPSGSGNKKPQDLIPMDKDFKNF